MKRLLYTAIIIFGVFFVMTEVYWCNYCIQNDELGIWLLENVLISSCFLIIASIFYTYYK